MIDCTVSKGSGMYGGNGIVTRDPIVGGNSFKRLHVMPSMPSMLGIPVGAM